MTAIELQKPSSLGHAHASVVATFAHRVFGNISKQYRLGLVSTGTLSHDLNRLARSHLACIEVKKFIFQLWRQQTRQK